MAWKIKIEKPAEKQLKKLGAPTRKLILSYLSERILSLGNPKVFGKALTGNLKRLWRYRVDNFRIICDIKDEELIVLVLKIGHRRDVYYWD